MGLSDLPSRLQKRLKLDREDKISVSRHEKSICKVNNIIYFWKYWRPVSHI